VGVIVEVVVAGVWGELLVVPAQHGVDGGGVGQAGELLALGSGKTHGVAKQIPEVPPVEILGLLDIERTQEDAAQPLGKERFGRGGGLRDAGEGSGENEHADVIAEHCLAGVGLPVWRKAFAGLGRAGRDRDHRKSVLGACFQALWNEVGRGRFEVLVANAFLRNGVRRRRCHRGWGHDPARA